MKVEQISIFCQRKQQEKHSCQGDVLVEGGRYKETERLERNIWKVSVRCTDRRYQCHPKDYLDHKWQLDDKEKIHPEDF
jgi:hypothetical protein